MPEGLKFDGGKLRMDLLDVEALKGIAGILTFGANKYGDRNWEKGIKWNRVYGAAIRHLLAFWAGEDTDSESGLSHLDHAATNLMFLQRFSRTHRHLDNRPSTVHSSVGNVDEGLVDVFGNAILPASKLSSHVSCAQPVNEPDIPF